MTEHGQAQRRARPAEAPERQEVDPVGDEVAGSVDDERSADRITGNALQQAERLIQRAGDTEHEADRF